MNRVHLTGVLGDVSYSHSNGNIPYSKATLAVKNSNGRESTINLKFKSLTLHPLENSRIDIVGQLRDHSSFRNGKSEKEIYVFTYFDECEEKEEFGNTVIIDGTINKIEPLYVNKMGVCNIHLMLLNKIVNGENKFTNFIPCVAWGGVARALSILDLNTPILIHGELKSREYKKYSDENEYEIKLAHELCIYKFEVLSNENDI